MREFFRKRLEIVKLGFKDRIGKVLSATIQETERSGNPFEESEVVPIATNLVAQANKLLNGKAEVSIVGPNDKIIQITGSEQAQKKEPLTKPKLIIYDVCIADNRLNSDTYFFYPYYVQIVSIDFGIQNTQAGKPDKSRRYANANDLAKLLLKLGGIQPQE